MKFSCIIPLYNKEAEIGRALRSALAQTLPPLEIVAVDDGSTDGGAAIVEEFEDPKIRLIRQRNAGVSAARNRAMTEAKGDFFAFLDADDEWGPGFLEEIAAMIVDFPGCGIYCTGYRIVDRRGVHDVRNLSESGVVDNFFRASLGRHIAIPSACVVPRTVIDRVGGFPEGMRLGEDQYLWTKIAARYPVCFSQKPQVRYHKAASNRSAATYKPETTRFSFEDFLASDDFWLREYVARVALGKALTIAAKGGERYRADDPRRAERAFAYTRHSRRLWWRLWVMDRLPRLFRAPFHKLYSALAWLISRKGL